MIATTENRRILIIDDNDEIHLDFRKTLRGNIESSGLAAASAALFGDADPSLPTVTFEVDSAMQGREGYEKVKLARHAGKPYALAFVDMRMPPGWDGMETIEHLFQEDPEVQVVVCTAYSDYSWEEMIGRIGRNDRVLILKKPFDRIEVCQLATALTEKWQLKRQSQFKLGELEAMVHERTRELKQIAMVDRLTGLPNRAHLLERLAAAIHRSNGPEAGQYGLLFLDFDRFKIVNDSLGHEIGDELLIEIARRIEGVLAAETLRGQDGFAARLGGDEFVVLLDINKGGDPAARAAGEAILDALAAPYRLAGHEMHCSASIGITTSSVGYERPHDMLRDADTAMYRAKLAGKGRCVVFDQQMHDEAVHRLTFESELRRAIERKELRLLYQPIYHVQSSLIVGFEALVRWEHPQRGMISPLEFIAIAEETGFIVPLGQWVLHEACRQMAEWRKADAAFANIRVNVNVSRRQLGDDGMIHSVEEALRLNDLPAGALNLEITESVVMDRALGSPAILAGLRKLGVGLHLDDFGTGYSSLNCLHTMPLTCLKIDQSFISTMVGRRDYAAVINAIVQLAHNLGISVVAEGVETREQVAMLLALDCDMAQGYLYAKPLAAEAAFGQVCGKVAAAI
jgi:diguanylate cyclase